MQKDEFAAKKTNWQGEDGYQVEQYHNGKVVCSQFVSRTYFETFCNETGIEPELTE
jgi:hypothetical protein